MRSAVHYHHERGRVHACWHKCQGILTSWQFWVGQFGFFVPEHWVWDKLPPFSYITHWVGL